MMKETAWHYYTENGRRYRVKARYGLDYGFARQYNQAPDFSVIGEVEYKSRNNHWYEHSAGQVTREIAAYVPEIAPYLKWHLVGPDGPMHYLENAKYWLEMLQGKISPPRYETTDPLENFKRTIVLGAFPGDVINFRMGPKEWSPRGFKLDLLDAPWSVVANWLENRLPKMIAAWAVDMGELGVLEE